MQIIKLYRSILMKVSFLAASQFSATVDNAMLIEELANLSQLLAYSFPVCKRHFH